MIGIGLCGDMVLQKILRSDALSKWIKELFVPINLSLMKSLMNLSLKQAFLENPPGELDDMRRKCHRKMT